MLIEKNNKPTLLHEKLQEMTVRTSCSFVQLRRFINESNAKILKQKYARKKEDNLTLLEARHLDYLISLIPEDAETLPTIEFDVADYWHACGIDPTRSGTYYRRSAEALQRLRDQSGYVQIIDPKTGEASIDLVSIIQKVKFTGDGYRRCRVNFDPNLAPALLALNDHFLRPLLLEKLHLETMVGRMLFELLCSYEYLHAPMTFEAEDLAERLNATDEYKAGTFKRKILDYAIEDINTHSNEVEVSYAPIKTGKRFSHYEFHLTRHSGICASVGDAKEEAASKVFSTKDLIKDQIDYPRLLTVLQSKNVQDNSLLIAIVDIIYDVLTTSAETIRIQSQEVSTADVQIRYRALTSEHVELVIERLFQKGKEIKSGLKQYIRSMLYNAIDDLSLEKAKASLPTVSQSWRERPLGEDEIAAIRRIMADETLNSPDIDAISS